MNEKPNVLLLVCDALRPDFLSCYNEDSSRMTPGFDRLAKQGVLFENAFTVGRNTPISHGVMFSGKYPSETGLVGGFRSIQDDTTTVAEHLSKNGYNSFAMSRRSGKLSSDFNHDKGFNEFFEPDRENIIPEMSKDYLLNAATDFDVFKDFIKVLSNGVDKCTNLKFKLLERKMKNSEQPFFSFINQITTHGPYVAPRPYLENVTPKLDRPRLFLTEMLASTLFGIETRELNHPDIRTNEVIDGHGFKDQNLDNEGWLNPNELSLIQQWYGSLVDYLDKQLDIFLDNLESSGLLNDTIILIAADHGEHLGEHDLIGHNNFLYDEVLQVPLIIAGPGVPEGERRQDLVSLIDLFETISDLVGIESPHDIKGQALFSSGHRDAVFAEYGVRDPKNLGYGHLDENIRTRISAGQKCVRTRNYKYVIDSEGEEYLYEIPTETELEVDEYRDVADDLETRLKKTLSDEYLRKKEHTEVELEQGSLDNLRELGYVE